MTKLTTYNFSANFRCLQNVTKQTDDLWLVHCGYQQCAPNYTYNHKIPNEYHLHFVLSGKGTLSISKTIYSIHAGDVFLIPKDIKIDYFADSCDPWEYIWVTFDGKMAKTYLDYIGISVESPVIPSAVPIITYLPLIQKILDTHQLILANEPRRIAYLYELLSLVIENQTSLKSKHTLTYSSQTYVDYALKYIACNYSSVRVKELADYIGIDRSYLTNIFKKKLGLSPQEYVVKYRLQKSEHFLTETSLSIQDVATMVGYQDVCAFSKIFKKHYHVSPSDYRKS